LFESAPLGLVAQAYVNADGTSRYQAGGVETRRVATGQYEIELPEGLAMPRSGCLLLAHSRNPPFPIITVVEHLTDAIKRVYTWNRVGGLSNSDFNICVFRSAGADVVKSPFVAFVDVAEDGTVSGLNSSGVIVAKVAVGNYRVTLPAELGQDVANVLMFVQLKRRSSDFPILTSIRDVAPFGTPLIKNMFFDNRFGGATDTPFSLIIMRSALPPLS